jgi:hypothetical protein
LVMRAVCLRRVTAATGLAAGTERVRIEADALAGAERRMEDARAAMVFCDLWRDEGELPHTEGAP